MIEILGRLRVADVDTFWAGFSERGRPLRERHGCRGTRVLRSLDDEQEVVVLLTWESREGFEAFRADPEVKESMARGGTLAPPDFTFLEPVGDLPG